MIRAFSKGLDAAALKKTQSAQHSEKLIISDTCPANTSKQSAAAVSNYGDFLCLQITGSFETLVDLDPQGTSTIIDSGIDYLKGRLIDGVGQRKLFTDYIPFHLWLTPGRRRSANQLVLNTYVGDPGTQQTFDSTGVVVIPAVAPVYNESKGSHGLFYPEEFEYIFSNSSQIIVEVVNSSNVALSYDIVFHGIRILNSGSVSNLPSRR